MTFGARSYHYVAPNTYVAAAFWNICKKTFSWHRRCLCNHHCLGLTLIKSQASASLIRAILESILSGLLLSLMSVACHCGCCRAWKELDFLVDQRHYKRSLLPLFSERALRTQHSECRGKAYGTSELSRQLPCVALKVASRWVGLTVESNNAIFLDCALI